MVDGMYGKKGVWWVRIWRRLQLNGYFMSTEGFIPLRFFCLLGYVRWYCVLRCSWPAPVDLSGVVNHVFLLRIAFNCVDTALCGSDWL